MIVGGFSQGGDIGVFAGYRQVVSRIFMLSSPPQAALINGHMTAASYFSEPKATDIRQFYGFVSTNDSGYLQGRFAAVWLDFGFTAPNDDGEFKLNMATPVGLNCNSGIPSHNLSTSAPPVWGGHTDTLYLWNEDVFKFMLID